MKIDAISFDLDGTLIETNDAWHQALDVTLKQLGKHDGVTKDYFYENHIGVDMKKVISSHILLTEPELEQARNFIAHNRSLLPSEFQRIYMYISDWNRVIGL